MKKLVIINLFLVSLFSSACKDKQPQDKVVVNNQMKVADNSTNESSIKKKAILCFGNSLTAGYGLEENQAWPYLLQQRIDSLNLEYTLVNAGLSGETTAGGLNRIDWVLNREFDVFILELGANDMLRGIDVKSTASNLDSIIVKAKSHNPNVKVIIAGMLSPPNMGADYEQEFNSIFKNLQNKHDASLIPFFLEGVAGQADLNLPDAKHPNEKGQFVVLENVWKVIEPLIS